MTQRVYNTTDGPLLVDRAGHTLGGRESDDVDTDAQPAKGHVEAGRLIVVEAPADEDEAPEDTKTDQQPAKRGRRTEQEG